MVVEWFDQCDRRSADACFSMRGAELGQALENVEAEVATLLCGDEDEVAHFVHEAADTILIANGWPSRPAPGPGGPIKSLVEKREADIDRTTEQYGVLYGYVRRAMTEMPKRDSARLSGTAVGQGFDPMFAGVGAGLEYRTRAVVQGRLGAAPKLSAIFGKWKRERQPSTKTAHEWSTAVRRFIEVCGDMPVDAITTAHVRDFKDALLQMPSVVGHRLRGKTVPRVVAATKDRDVARLSAGTVNKQITALRALLSWCRKNGYVASNVAAEMSVPTAKNDRDRRLPYSADDMRALFSGLDKYRNTEPSKFWLPLLAAYTGARLEELGHLRTTDVRCRDGIDYVDINTDDEGKSLKTRSSRREVPLHPDLLRCGFLEHVERRKASGGGRLFPDLKPDTHGVLTGTFSKWWTRYRKECGVTDRRKVFHSFRHGFKEACRAAGIGEEVHDALTGHAGGGVGRSYGGVPLGIKAREISSVRYGDLDLPCI